VLEHLIQVVLEDISVLMEVALQSPAAAIDASIGSDAEVCFMTSPAAVTTEARRIAEPGSGPFSEGRDIKIQAFLSPRFPQIDEKSSVFIRGYPERP
jgi:hypothetical protein